MKELKFKHLVLLVGTNPLPNLVVADYFLQINKKLEKIWLIHSEKTDRQAGTKNQADNLEKVLKKRWDTIHSNLKFPFEKIALKDVSQSITICNDIDDEKITDSLKSGAFHFNYTGGTKTMSTHVYWKLKSSENLLEKSFSYLDARNFQLVIDDLDSVHIPEKDLRDHVSLSLQELIELHGFERKNKDKEFHFSDSLQVFQSLIENNNLKIFYGEQGYERRLFTDKKGNLAEKIKKLNYLEELRTYQPNNIFKSLVCKLPDKFKLFNDKNEFNEKLENNKFKSVVKFLDGEWLEYHVLKTLEKALEDKNIITEQNWVIKKPEWSKNLDFELDVPLIHGYQLIGISCTTSSAKSLCKSKGFEIIHRTRQIGGDEAKAALITCLDKIERDKLETELKYDTGLAMGNIKVFGLIDLKKETLIKKMTNFLSGNHI